MEVALRSSVLLIPSVLKCRRASALPSTMEMFTGTSGGLLKVKDSIESAFANGSLVVYLTALSPPLSCFD